MQKVLNKNDNKYMRFLLNISVLILLVVAADQAIGSVLRHFYFRQVAGDLYRATYTMDSTTEDIIVLGSSRANHHYVPSVFEDSLKMSFYNGGRDGSFVLSNVAFFKAIVKRYNPKIILFDIDPEELLYTTDSYEKLSALLPYYRTHPEIRSIIELRGPYEKYKHFSAIYPFNSCILSIGIGNMEMNKNRKGDIKGYVPLKKTQRDTIPKPVPSNKGTLDHYKLEALTDMMQYCTSHNITLRLIFSPVYTVTDSSENMDVIEQIARKYQTPFWNFSTDTSFLSSPEYFYDFRHLNQTGANNFSKVIVRRLLDGNNDIADSGSVNRIKNLSLSSRN
jgi:hypothetical protein